MQINSNPTDVAKEAHSRSLNVDETYWGYILRDKTRQKSSEIITQALVGFVGLCAVVAALGLWVLPGSFMGSDVAVLKLGMTVILCALGVLALWYGTTSQKYELQVDLNKGEFREVLRSKKGQTTQIARHSFDQVSNIFVVRQQDDEKRATLVLQISDDEQTVESVEALETELLEIQSRLSKDIKGVTSRPGMQKTTRNERQTAAGVGKAAALAMGQ